MMQCEPGLSWKEFNSCVPSKDREEQQKKFKKKKKKPRTGRIGSLEIKSRGRIKGKKFKRKTKEEKVPGKGYNFGIG